MHVSVIGIAFGNKHYVYQILLKMKTVNVKCLLTNAIFARLLKCLYSFMEMIFCNSLKSLIHFILTYQRGYLIDCFDDVSCICSILLFSELLIYFD